MPCFYEQEILEAVSNLESLGTSISQVITNGTQLNSGTVEYLNRLVGQAKNIRVIGELHRARIMASQFTNDLRRSNGSGVGSHLFLHTTSMSFPIARLLATQAYLSSAWAEYDSLTTAISLFVRRSKNWGLPESCNLVSDYFCRSGNENTLGIPSLPFHILSETYGWYACFTYVVRNCLVHDGGYMNGKSIFASNEQSDGFLVAREVWKEFEKRTLSKGFTQERLRYSVPISDWLNSDEPAERYDLLKAIDFYFAQTDEACGCILHWVVNSLVRFSGGLFYPDMN
jgi:hypothetical protein